ncbi:3-beta-hydroxysteroid-Delta(8),Delta(7)-isomerase [Neosynchiropus ocellatus]
MDRTAAPPHPFYPRDLVIPSYVPNELSMGEILAFLFSASGAVLALTWLMSSGLGWWRRLAVSWFAICGFIHGVIEGWFSLYHDVIPGDRSLLSQLWKEYGRGDSRYMIEDNFTVCMETVTACLWGPLSCWTVLAFLTHRSYRFVLQLVVSLGQLYGAVLYFFTEHRDGYSHSQPGHPVFFWFYFVFMNALWIVIPLALIVDAWGQLAAAQAHADAAQTHKPKRK